MIDDRLRRSLAAGEPLFSQGDSGTAAFVIETGAIEIYVDDAGDLRPIAKLGVNDIFGEMALLGDSVRSASARALEPTRLLVVTPEHLTERLSAADPLTRHLLRTVVQRCRELLRRQRGLPTEGATPAADALPGEESGQASDRSLAIHRIRTEQALEAALQNDEFQLHFQPIVRLADRAVAGYEALLRWHKPGQGLVPPGEFIGIAEASTFIHRLGRWILSAAVDGLLALDARLPARSEPLFMTVNLSARQLEDPELLDTITREAGRLVGRYCQLKLEITESLMIGNVAEVQKFIGHCRGAGVPVVLDDFGTGFCSLSYLHLFDVHTMKLDRSFVRGMTVSLASEKVVRGVTRMAHDLGLVVVAEGIEREDEAAQASAIGINYAQGYLFGRPQPLTKILAARS